MPLRFTSAVDNSSYRIHFDNRALDGAQVTRFGDGKNMADNVAMTLVLTSLFAVLGNVDSQLMYSFGPAQGDAVLDSMDDGGAGPIKLAMSFPFFSATYDSLYVSIQSYLFACVTGVF